MQRGRILENLKLNCYNAVFQNAFPAANRLDQEKEATTVEQKIKAQGWNNGEKQRPEQTVMFYLLLQQ